MNPDLLVVATYDGTIQALDAETGSLHWQRQTKHRYGGQALVHVGSTIIGVSLDGSLIALALADGAIQWEARLPDVPPGVAPSGSLRALARGQTVVVQFDRSYFRIDTADGHVRWISGGTKAVQGPWLLAVGQSHAYVLSMDSPLPGSLPPQTPSAWTKPIFVMTKLSTWDASIEMGWREQSASRPGWDGASTLVEADGVFYVYGHTLSAIDADTNRLVWTSDSAPPDGSALILAHHLVIGIAEKRLGAYHRDTGSMAWSVAVPPPKDGIFELFNGLVVLGDMVYVGRGSNGDRPFQIEGRTVERGELMWAWPPDNTPLRFDVSWRFCGAGDTLYVPSGETIWALRASNGELRWSRDYPYMLDAYLAIAADDANANAE